MILFVTKTLVCFFASFCFTYVSLRLYICIFEANKLASKMQHVCKLVVDANLSIYV